ALESATQIFERARQALSEGRVDHVARAVIVRDAPETEYAHQFVERSGDRQSVLRFVAARDAFVEALQSRTSDLALETAENRQLVLSLEREALWEGRSVNGVGFAMFIALAAIIVGAAFWEGHDLRWLVAGCLPIVAVVGFFPERTEVARDEADRRRGSSVVARRRSAWLPGDASSSRAQQPPPLRHLPGIRPRTWPRGAHQSAERA
ncbi:MAG: hypothetical protein ACO1OB_28430, partial [Archangium sp.]